MLTPDSLRWESMQIWIEYCAVQMSNVLFMECQEEKRKIFVYFHTVSQLVWTQVVSVHSDTDSRNTNQDVLRFMTCSYWLCFTCRLVVVSALTTQQLNPSPHSLFSLWETTEALLHCVSSRAACAAPVRSSIPVCVTGGRRDSLTQYHCAVWIRPLFLSLSYSLRLLNISSFFSFLESALEKSHTLTSFLSHTV